MQKNWSNSRRVQLGAPFIFKRLNVKRIFFILLTETVFRKNTEFNLLKIGRTNKNVLQAQAKSELSFAFFFYIMIIT